MIYLYHGGGASITDMSGPLMPEDAWSRIRNSVIRLLRARGHLKAAKILVEYPFELLHATNFFQDEFAILRLVTGVDQYVALTEVQHDAKAQEPFKVVAETISELGTYVRFIVMQMDSDEGPLPVSTPSPKITSESVESALADAELLLRSRGAANALDRVHTALHGYLRAALERAGETPSPTASITDLFKRLRQQRAELSQPGPHSDEIKRVTMALSTIIDAANTLRNTASAAHPATTLLDAPEAMLVINAARSLIHYLDERLSAR